MGAAHLPPHVGGVGLPGHVELGVGQRRLRLVEVAVNADDRVACGAQGRGLRAVGDAGTDGGANAGDRGLMRGALLEQLVDAGTDECGIHGWELLGCVAQRSRLRGDGEPGAHRQGGALRRLTRPSASP
jgi:hypothetical protein